MPSFVWISAKIAMFHYLDVQSPDFIMWTTEHLHEYFFVRGLLRILNKHSRACPYNWILPACAILNDSICYGHCNSSIRFVRVIYTRVRETSVSTYSALVRSGSTITLSDGFFLLLLLLFISSRYVIYDPTPLLSIRDQVRLVSYVHLCTHWLCRFMPSPVARHISC